MLLVCLKMQVIKGRVGSVFTELLNTVEISIPVRIFPGGWKAKTIKKKEFGNNFHSHYNPF